MLTLTREKKEKKEETKNLTYCVDCCSIVETEQNIGAWIKCPYCNTQFQFTKRVIRKR